MLLNQVNSESSHGAQVTQGSRVWRRQLPELCTVSTRPLQRSHWTTAAVLRSHCSQQDG